MKEVALVRSPTSGPALRVALDRRMLARVLSLGCHTLKLTPDKPIAAEGEGFTLVVVPLDTDLVVQPTADARKTSTDASSITPDQSTTTPQRRNYMPPPDTNGHTPPRGDPPDSLFAAEELRDALADATAKAARLVAALKAGRREKKVLASVFANLKQLGLDSGVSP